MKVVLHPQFFTDAEGHRKSVLISYDEYLRIVELLEEIEDIQDYDERKDSHDWISLSDVENELNIQDEV